MVISLLFGLLLAFGLLHGACGGNGFNGISWRKNNDGHPLCNGGDSNWPFLMCWGSRGGLKHYNCMWYTMEMLSGWPGTPRAPGLTCDDIEIDCASSFICTVLLEYRGVGPMPHFGEESDRAIAAECLIKQCPKEAAVAEAVVEGVPGARCPHTHVQVTLSSTTTETTTATSTSVAPTTLQTILARTRSTATTQRSNHSRYTNSSTTSLRKPANVTTSVALHSAGHKAYTIGQFVERRDKGERWGVGYVTSIDPLKVTVINNPHAAGYAWDEVRPWSQVLDGSHSLAAVSTTGKSEDTAFKGVDAGNSEEVPAKGIDANRRHGKVVSLLSTIAPLVIVSHSTPSPPAARSTLSLSGLGIAALSALAATALFLFKPRVANRDARDVLLPPAEAREDIVQELEAVQETDRMQVAVNDAE